MKRVLLTGVGGFCGSHCLEHLLVNTDWEIVCIDSFRHRGKTSRIREVLAGKALHAGASLNANWEARVKVLTHDLRVPIDAQLDQEIGWIDYVISMASESHVDRSINEPRTFIENNVQLILTLLDWACGHRPEKFLHISTDEVFGPAPPDHEHGEEEPFRPSNPYAASKAMQTDAVYAYWRTYGLPVGVTQTMNIIGERQDPEKFVPLVLSRVTQGKPVPIHASEEGRPGSRFYLHARNQADALLFLLETQPFPVYSAGEMGRWNVVGEREVNNLEMATMIADFAGRHFNYDLVSWHSSRPGHDLRYALDGTKMRNLSWVPPLPLEESLEKTVHWTLAHPHWLLDG